MSQIKYFIDNIDPHTYDDWLDEVQDDLKVPAENLVSVKIRPLKLDKKEYRNAYVGFDDYKEIKKEIDADGSLRSTPGKPYNSRVLTTEQGLEILYVEHESGPELIFNWESVLKIVECITVIGGLILMIMELIKRRSEKDKKVDFITVEERKKGKVKVLQIIVPEKLTKASRKELVDLLKKELKK